MVSKNGKASPSSWATMVSWWSWVQQSLHPEKCGWDDRKVKLLRHKNWLWKTWGLVFSSLSSSSFLENPVAGTGFIRLRVGKRRRVTKLIWGSIIHLFFLSLHPSIPLSFSSGVRITWWYWTHLLYTTGSEMDRLAFHTQTHKCTYAHTCTLTNS